MTARDDAARVRAFANEILEPLTEPPMEHAYTPPPGRPRSTPPETLQAAPQLPLEPPRKRHRGGWFVKPQEKEAWRANMRDAVIRAAADEEERARERCKTLNRRLPATDGGRWLTIAQWSSRTGHSRWSFYKMARRYGWTITKWKEGKHVTIVFIPGGDPWHEKFPSRRSRPTQAAKPEQVAVPEAAPLVLSDPLPEPPRAYVVDVVELPPSRASIFDRIKLAFGRLFA
ncbi:MAG: hypothetical protein U1E23_09335 [Reyranellaceae bacterium]